jgi:PAS domain S-box-containing protein
VASLARLAETGTVVSWDTPIEDRQGRLRVLGSRATFLSERPGQPPTLARGALADVTEPRGRERASARESDHIRRRLQGFFDSAAVGMAIVSPTGEPVAINNALASMLGYSPEELIGLNFTRFTHEDDLPAELPLFERIVAGEIDNYTIEKRYLAKNGAEIPIRLWLSAIRDSETGKPENYVAIVEDIGDQRRAEAEQEALAERLRRSQKLEAIGQLAGGVAHDFNNLLTVILGNAALLLELTGERGDRHSLEEIVDAGERAGDLVRQLLTFSNSHPVVPEIVDLNEIVITSRALLRRLIESTIEISLQLHPEPLPVLADRGQLEQVLLNLAVNARDAMPRGGRLAIATSLGEADGTPCAALSIRDDGQGMGEETLEHIFDPFYTTKEAGHGTGLGLATVNAIVDGLGGSIAVSSTPGAGSTFTLSIPLRRGEETLESAGGDVRGAEQDDHDRRALLLDDDAHVREIVGRMLAGAGYTVASTATADEALRIGESELPLDVLVTDLVMPAMNGLEVARRMRALRPTLPVLFVSGDSHGLHGELEHFERSRYLPKPFTAAELQHVLDSLLADEASRT